MDRFLFESFVFEFDDEEMLENSLIAFAQDAKNKVERTGNKKITFNYYPQKENRLQLVIEAIKKNDVICVNNLKIHHTSPNVWKIKIINPLNDFDGHFMASQENDEGFIIIRLVNEQVLGKINEGDVIEAQVVGIAIVIDIFKNDEDYKKHVPAGKDGQKLFMANGTLIPTNIIINNNANLTKEEREQKNHDFDNLVDFKGTIKNCWKYPLNIYDLDVNSYYAVEIETSYGPLHIIIPQPMIPKNLDGFGVGNVIIGKIILSGDVCINKYEKYATKLDK